VLLLGETGDPRGIPLLRRALQSHNYQIVAWAAKGSALIQDKQSIPLIIAAVQRAPPEDKSLIAESLIYFDEAQAQGAVETYVPKDKATLARAERARGRGVFGW
jgi:HEAT repeat protein